MATPALEARDLSVQFQTTHQNTARTIRGSFANAIRFGRPRKAERRWRTSTKALNNINLTVQPGEIVGLIGRNGAGKTTLLRTLAGILGPDEGEVTLRGRVSCLLGFGVGFNPFITGRENIFLSASLIGIPQRQVLEALDEIIAFSELGDAISAPVQTYSHGMRVRLGFAIAAHVASDLLLLDEVLAAGDAAFRKKAGTLIEHIAQEHAAVLVASHNLEIVKRFCTRTLWLESGHVQMDATPEVVCAAYTESIRQERQPHPSPPENR